MIDDEDDPVICIKDERGQVQWSGRRSEFVSLVRMGREWMRQMDLAVSDLLKPQKANYEPGGDHD